MIKAVLFDMDGVLLDAKEWHYEALNMALELHDELPISRDDHLGKFDGLPTKVKLKALGYNKFKIDSINASKQNFTLELIRENFKPSVDILNALKVLKNEGYKLALCSNSVRETLDLFLELSDYKWYFDLTLSNQDVTKGKPNPEIYQKACLKLGVEPYEALVLEDNHNGIKAAKDAGCKVLIVSEGANQVNYKFIMDKINEG